MHSNDLSKKHTSLIMYRGNVLEFTEPVDERELQHFLEQNKPKQYTLDGQPISTSLSKTGKLQEMTVNVCFHGAGLSPWSNISLFDTFESLLDDMTIYYFPNNQMREPTGFFDRLAGKLVPHPSKQDAEKNGKDAAQTLATICRNIYNDLPLTNVVPFFHGVSAGVYTMLSCIKDFINKCKENITQFSVPSEGRNSWANNVYLLKQHIVMHQIPAAGYKGATPEQSAQALLDIDQKLSELYEHYRGRLSDSDFRRISEDDFYNVKIHDDLQWLFFRPHNVNNSKCFLEYLNNQSHLCLPMHIYIYESSPSFPEESKFLSEIPKKYKNMKDVVLTQFDKDGRRSVIYDYRENQDSKKYPDIKSPFSKMSSNGSFKNVLLDVIKDSELVDDGHIPKNYKRKPPCIQSVFCDTKTKELSNQEINKHNLQSDDRNGERDDISFDKKMLLTKQDVANKENVNIYKS